MTQLFINNLSSGGLITNYYCSSKCKHCLYACSPKWDKEYISTELTSKIFKKIKKLNCHSIHIGGGEPFLDTGSLFKVLKIADNENINIQYIETNSSWLKNESESIDILKTLKKLNVNTLLISISPFHNEHIPFYKVKELIKLCNKASINIFPWIQDFYKDISYFDENKTHTLDEYKKQYGENYIKNIPSRYWIHFGGRANELYKNIYDKKDINHILNTDLRCLELSDVSHFHIDLSGNYIPGLCSGFSINFNDIGDYLDINKYPFINNLYTGGIKSFLNIAKEKYGFIPEKKYLSKCDLCLDIRKFMVLKKGVNSIELQPFEFYKNL